MAVYFRNVDEDLHTVGSSQMPCIIQSKNARVSVSNLRAFYLW